MSTLEAKEAKFKLREESCDPTHLGAAEERMMGRGSGWGGRGGSARHEAHPGLGFRGSSQKGRKPQKVGVRRGSRSAPGLRRAQATRSALGEAGRGAPGLGRAGRSGPRGVRGPPARVWAPGKSRGLRGGAGRGRREGPAWARRPSLAVPPPGPRRRRSGRGGPRAPCARHGRPGGDVSRSADPAPGPGCPQSRRRGCGARAPGHAAPAAAAVAAVAAAAAAARRPRRPRAPGR